MSKTTKEKMTADQSLKNMNVLRAEISSTGAKILQTAASIHRSGAVSERLDAFTEFDAVVLHMNKVCNRLLSAKEHHAAKFNSDGTEKVLSLDVDKVYEKDTSKKENVTK